MFKNRFSGIFLIILLNVYICIGQEIELFQQFNGRYDYIAFGNTLNPNENNLDQSFCDILTSSSSEFNLGSEQEIIAAYLYWSGSGTSDENVSLNNIDISAEQTYLVSFNTSEFGELFYFSCFADVTSQLIDTGNGTYTFSQLDISESLNSNPGFCETRTNFAGWSIYVIYSDNSLPLNQVSLFQGLEIINANVNEKIIQIDNINVLDNTGAKIGFLTWEGDLNLEVNESLAINGNLISNPPLNPVNNAFNGTNSFTNSTDFYNVDLDFYYIQNNIEIGDTSAEIRLTSGQDLIIINNIITVLNSQLPDATIAIDNYELECNSRSLSIEYTVFNTNSTALLPSNTPLAFYADGELIYQSNTISDIPINGNESNSVVVQIPDHISNFFSLTIKVDDDGSGSGIINEINENNNITISDIELLESPEIGTLPELVNCDIGFNTATFNLTEILQFINSSFNVNSASFFESLEDAELNFNEILLPENYTNNTSPQTIFIRLEDDPCYRIYQFEILVENCPPFLPQGFSPNEDGYNDWFNIQGLYNIFENHKLLIYNRYGTLLFEGNNLIKWDGTANRGLNNKGKILPVGTYFYVLYLNDKNYTPLTGWVYLNY